MSTKILGEVPLKLLKDDRGNRQWSHGFPFFVNPRGALVHRVRSAGSILWDGVRHHDYVHYWCGNGTTFTDTDAMVAVPPNGRLLCERCEALAMANNEKSASAIAGKHVHVGKMVAVRTCCRDCKN